jgi:amidase
MAIVVERFSIGQSGPTVMVKDTIDVAGYATRASSQALQSAQPAELHAAVVQQLLESGCHLIGKTSLHELAFGTTGINRWVGTPVNPRYPDRIPGGSSSGSAAAVAAGLADFALGTDTGGSVRIPACCCGVFGFKPTFGRVSRVGVMPAETSLDCVGPFASSLSMLVTAMQAIDPTFQQGGTAREVRIKKLRVKASERISSVIGSALSATGMIKDEIEFDNFDAAYHAGMVVINRETFAACGHLIESGLVGEDISGRLEAAGRTSDEQLALAEKVRQSFTAEVDAAVADGSILALPTMPDFPLKVVDASDTRAVLGMTSLVRPFNLSGHPALTIPLISREGLPAGLQLIAAKGQDEALLAAADEILQRLYSNTNWSL